MSDSFKLTLVLAAALALLLSAPSLAFSQDRVHIILRAFIPSSHPGSDDVLLPVPGAPGHVMVKASIPLVGSSFCFESDNRSFSNSPSASARVAANFTLVAGPLPKVEPTAVAGRFKAGATKRLSCTTGKLEKSGTAALKDCTMGQPAYADKQTQVVLSCKASNPIVALVPEAVTADIHFAGSFTYDSAAKTLSFKGDIGAFPSFEAYASRNAGPFVKLFAVPPGSGAGAMSLVDLWQHVNTRSINVPATKL